jgi:CheY-like chemotaxis protein
VARRILIVDDSPHFRGAACELLTGSGFELFDEAADGEQALAAVAHECPDGILLDINLPGPNGFEVAVALAAACSATKVVLTSADVDHVPDRILRSCTAIAFVRKQELANTDFDALFGLQ